MRTTPATPVGPQQQKINQNCPCQRARGQERKDPHPSHPEDPTATLYKRPAQQLKQKQQQKISQMNRQPHLSPHTKYPDEENPRNYQQ